MGDKLGGNIRGLAPSQIKAAERLYRRSLRRDEVVTLDVAREIIEVSKLLNRRIGVLVNREGRIEDVFAGTKEILYLPSFGRLRESGSRLRRLRLIYSETSNKPNLVIPSDIYTDLEKLRLDMVVGVRSEKADSVSAIYAHLLPLQAGSSANVATELVKDLGRLDLNFENFIAELEDEISNTLGGQKHIPNSAVLVGVYEKKNQFYEDSMAELKELARTAGVEVVDCIIQRRELDPKTLVGKGKLEEIVLHCLRRDVEIIIFDTELKPTQWRIITNSTDLKVVDRSMLILDIFSQRAQSSEGRLQVELAQLKYNLPRLVEQDAGLSRLTGGIGGRGPGETKLEISRRRSRERILLLEDKLTKVSSQREQQRSKRNNSGLPLIAILGYTNVGKSTIFNFLTNSKVLAENKLFATLEPAQRKVYLPGIAEDQSDSTYAVISDTVGFIRSLPKELYTAFKATLEELYQADLLVHVVDASDPRNHEAYLAVNKILDDMAVSVKSIVVLNKCDLIAEDQQAELKNLFETDLLLSAQNGTGFPHFLKRVREEVAN